MTYSNYTGVLEKSILDKDDETWKSSASMYNYENAVVLVTSKDSCELMIDIEIENHHWWIPNNDSAPHTPACYGIKDPPERFSLKRGLANLVRVTHSMNERLDRIDGGTINYSVLGSIPDKVLEHDTRIGSSEADVAKLGSRISSIEERLTIKKDFDVPEIAREIFQSIDDYIETKVTNIVRKIAMIEVSKEEMSELVRRREELQRMIANHIT